MQRRKRRSATGRLKATRDRFVSSHAAPRLCGHVLDASSNGNGEAVLINMKPKAAALWSGNIYSRGSGNTYYGTIEMKGPNSLRVEACALGRFFCSGNLWSRIDANPRS